MYDLAIIGGGPAGVTAGVYAARKKLKTLFVAAEFGGQSVVSPDIQNWIGTPHISGGDLAKSLEAHVREYAADIVDIIVPAKIATVEKADGGFSLTTEKGDTYEARAVLVASGSHRRRLSVPGADEFEHKGLTYCATCDGPLFADKNVVVVGGGNAGFETALQLLAYAKSVTLLNRSGAYKADEVTVAKAEAHENFTGLRNADIRAVHGEVLVTGITYSDTQANETHELAVEGIFVEIGMLPNTTMVKDIVSLNEIGQIHVDPMNQKTSCEGVWAAGDCTDGKYHQNNIAAGDAVKALEDLYGYLK